MTGCTESSRSPTQDKVLYRPWCPPSLQQAILDLLGVRRQGSASLQSVVGGAADGLLGCLHPSCVAAHQPDAHTLVHLCQMALYVQVGSSFRGIPASWTLCPACHCAWPRSSSAHPTPPLLICVTSGWNTCEGYAWGSTWTGETDRECSVWEVNWRWRPDLFSHTEHH